MLNSRNYNKTSFQNIDNLYSLEEVSGQEAATVTGGSYGIPTTGFSLDRISAMGSNILGYGMPSTNFSLGGISAMGSNILGHGMPSTSFSLGGISAMGSNVLGHGIPSLPSVSSMTPTANLIAGYVPSSMVIGGMPGSGIFGISSSIFNMGY